MILDFQLVELREHKCLFFLNPTPPPASMTLGYDSPSKPIQQACQQCKSQSQLKVSTGKADGFLGGEERLTTSFLAILLSTGIANKSFVVSTLSTIMRYMMSPSKSQTEKQSIRTQNSPEPNMHKPKIHLLCYSIMAIKPSPPWAAVL